MQEDVVAARLRLADQRDVGFAAERAFERETCPFRDERPRFLQEQASRPERAERGIERGESAGELTANFPVRRPSG